MAKSETQLSHITWEVNTFPRELLGEFDERFANYGEDALRSLVIEYLQNCIDLLKDDPSRITLHPQYK